MLYFHLGTLSWVWINRYVHRYVFILALFEIAKNFKKCSAWHSYFKAYYVAMKENVVYK